MVFESVVVELVNRFLGDYIENLDKSQLSMSIWGGVSRYCIRLVTVLCLYDSSYVTDRCSLAVPVRIMHYD